jgi:hypothetical protein
MLDIDILVPIEERWLELTVEGLFIPIEMPFVL